MGISNKLSSSSGSSRSFFCSSVSFSKTVPSLALTVSGAGVYRAGLTGVIMGSRGGALGVIIGNSSGLGENWELRGLSGILKGSSRLAAFSNCLPGVICREIFFRFFYSVLS